MREVLLCIPYGSVLDWNPLTPSTGIVGVGSQPWKLPGWNQRQGEADHSRWVSGSFYKHGNFFMRLALDGCTCLPEPSSLHRSRTWVWSHSLSRWSRQHLTVSRLCMSLRQLPLWEQWETGAGNTGRGAEGGQCGTSDGLNPTLSSNVGHVLLMISSNSWITW